MRFNIFKFLILHLAALAVCVTGVALLFWKSGLPLQQIAGAASVAYLLQVIAGGLSVLLEDVPATPTPILETLRARAPRRAA